MSRSESALRVMYALHMVETMETRMRELDVQDTSLSSVCRGLRIILTEPIDQIADLLDEDRRENL